MRVPPVCLTPDDAAELGELLAFLAEWIDRESRLIDAALELFCGSPPGYDAVGLREDLTRFASLLQAGGTR